MVDVDQPPSGVLLDRQVSIAVPQRGRPSRERERRADPEPKWTQWQTCETTARCSSAGRLVTRACLFDARILPACADQHVPIIRPDPAILNPGILRYFLVCPAMQEQLLSWAESGGTRNALTERTIEAFFPLQRF